MPAQALPVGDEARSRAVGEALGRAGETRVRLSQLRVNEFERANATSLVAIRAVPSSQRTA